MIAPFPLSLMLAGRTGTGESYLTWQLFRRPNHDWLFYPVDGAGGGRPAGARRGRCRAVAAAGGRRSWRERLLLCWIAVPVAFFQLWPVKGFQYLLPIARAARRARRAALLVRRRRPLAGACARLR